MRTLFPTNETADGELGILVQVHKTTTLALAQDEGGGANAMKKGSKHAHRQLGSKKTPKSSGKPVVWEVESSPNSGEMRALNGGKAVTSAEYIFEEPGAHKVCMTVEFEVRPFDFSRRRRNGAISALFYELLSSWSFRALLFHMSTAEILGFISFFFFLFFFLQPWSPFFL